MDILKDEAIVLKKKNVNEANVSLLIFTKNYGKISCIAYGVRKSNKKEKISLSPFSYIDIELNKKNSDYTLSKHTLIKNFKNIYTSLEKIQLSYYMVYVLNNVLEYNQEEKNIYDKVKEIFVFLENLDNNKLKDKKFYEMFIIRFLKRLIIELGIYSEKILNYTSIKEYEIYLNKYFSINIDYENVLLGG